MRVWRCLIGVRSSALLPGGPELTPVHDTTLNRAFLPRGSHTEREIYRR